ncbi:MAG: LysR family transcriptional regulator [Pseudobdellovibrionaceae bacterium]
MEQLDLNQIRIFVKLVQTGSFTKTAELLHQPKSRISRRLAALEKELGVQLIYRTTRQFQLTETGRVYFERVQGLVEGLESLSTELSNTTSEVSGIIKLTASDDMGIKLLPSILDEFLKQYPQVRFEVRLSQAYLDLVKDSIDVAVRIGALKDSSLRARKVGTVKNIFVATPGFLERHRNWEDLDQLETLPFIAMTTMSKLEVLRGAENKKLMIKPNIILRSNNPAMMVELALLGKGYAFAPEFLCVDHVRSGRLVHIHKNLHGQEAPISVVTPEKKESSLKIKKFTDFLSKRLKDMLMLH